MSKFLDKMESVREDSLSGNTNERRVNTLPAFTPPNNFLKNFGYSLGETIGTGSFSKVKIARSARHHCYVAIKIIERSKTSQQYLTKFLTREIDVVKSLNHENLIQFYQAIETTKRFYIVMEYANGGTLLNIIRNKNYIEEIQARIWFYQLVCAVNYCHLKGVVHRDIKCENLLIDACLKVKLSDFGFAKGNMFSVNGIYPLSTTFCGSYAYASPEVLKGIPYSPQYSDIWSMGVVLFAIVFGKLPFNDSNYPRLVQQVENALKFPQKPTISTACQGLILKLIAPLKMRIKMTDIFSDPWLLSKITISNSENSKKVLHLHSPVYTIEC